jgi:glycosyltransferase involved in cell wall biosynthesis
MRLVVDLQGAQGSSRFRGIGRYSRELALAMARAPGRHEVVVALNGALPCDELRDAFLQVLPQDAVRVWDGIAGTAELEPENMGRRAAAEALRAQVLASLKPDLLHVASLFEGTSDDVVSVWPAGLQRVPTVATCYDLIPLIQRADYLDSAWHGPVSRWYFRRLQQLSLSDGLLAISESSRREAIDHLGYPEGQIFNIRAGIGPLFAPRRLDAAARAAFLRRLGLREGFVLFVGAGDRRKNEAGLIRAFGLLPQALRDAHQLVIVGKTSPDELAQAAKGAGVRQSDLLQLPFVEEEDLPALYATCTLFVLPSLHEGFGLPAAEAMACGAPTIASETTSLPEVIGRADALFDPARPESIAARMEQALTSQAFRQSLAEHGIRQAGTFTWEDSARRAWAALEAIQARHAAGPATAPRPVLGRRTSLAVVSPLPPDESGIADYASEMVPALARHYDITLVSDRGSTGEERLAANFPVLDSDTFLAQAGRFDRILYQIGNSHFHARQIADLLPAAPGVVTLHDGYISGVTQWMADHAGAGGPRFQRAMLASHGWPAAALAARDPMAALLRYPCSLPVLRAAIGTIQHSRHARDIASAHYGDGIAQSIAVIPHLRQVPPPIARAAARRKLGVAEDAFLVCSFGIAATRKLPDRILAAWRAVTAAHPAARLTFVGEALSEVEALLGPGALRKEPSVVVTGRVDAGTYALWLAAADVAVQLREGSRGETSGAVADCIAAGLPVIVNAEGALDELPDTVVQKLPRLVDPAALSAAILGWRDAARRGAQAEASRHHVRSVLAPDRIALRYRDAIEAFYAESMVSGRLAVTRSAAESPALDSAALPAVAQAIAQSFPGAGPAQLLLDAALAGDGLATAWSEWVAACLAGHPQEVRVHLVRGDGDLLRTEPVLACRLLGLDGFGAEPEGVALRPTDVLLLAAQESAVGAAAVAATRRRGARVLSLGVPAANAPAVDSQLPPGLQDLPPEEAVAALLAPPCGPAPGAWAARRASAA